MDALLVEAEQRLPILTFRLFLFFKYGPLILDNVSIATNDGQSTEMGEVRASI